MWTDTSGERRVDDQPVSIPDRIRFLAEALTRLDAMGFGSAIEKARQLESLLRLADLQILPAIPEPRAR
jgi:hypothetical protein